MIEPHANIRYYGRQLELNGEYKFYPNYTSQGYLYADGLEERWWREYYQYYPCYVQSENEDIFLLETKTETVNNRQYKYIILGLSSEDIVSLKRNTLGELFRTCMASYELETTKNLSVGTYLTLQLSVVNYPETTYYGRFKIYSKTSNIKSKTYTYVLVDDMIKTNKVLKKDDMFNKENGGYVNTSIKECISNILQACGLSISYLYSQTGENNYKIANQNREISSSLFDNKDIYGKITCRTMLDYLLQLTGCSLGITSSSSYCVAFLSHTERINKTMQYGSYTYWYYAKQNIPQKEILNVDANNIEWFEIQAIRIIPKDGNMYTVGYDFLRSGYVTNPTDVDAYCIKDNIIIDNLTSSSDIENIAKDLLLTLYCWPKWLNKSSQIGFYTLTTSGIDYLEFMDCLFESNNDRYYTTMAEDGMAYNGDFLLCLQNTTTVADKYEETFTNEKTEEFIHIDKEEEIWQ